MNEAFAVFIRGIIAFITLLILTRFLGKEQIAQLTFFDYVNGITIGSIAASMTTNLTLKPYPQFIGLLTWSGAVFLLQWGTVKWRYLSKYAHGEPTVIIMNGQIMENAMRTLRLRISDLLSLLRTNKIFDLSQVEFAVFETSGKLSVLKKAEYQNVTLKDMNLPAQYRGLSTELIFDGVVMDQNLKNANLDRVWLDKELRKLNIKDSSEVFLANLDTQGKLYVDRYLDKVKNIIDPSDYNAPS